MMIVKFFVSFVFLTVILWGIIEGLKMVDWKPKVIKTVLLVIGSLFTSALILFTIVQLF